MRQIIFDTETTGLNVQSGNRIIEIGGVELVNRRPTGNTFHHYINPDRDSEPGALAVHGLTTEFLSTKPRFEEIVDSFLEFVSGAEIVAHNAQFDVGFINAELSRCGERYGCLADHVAGVVDTLVIAKQRFPGQRINLDVLCARFDIDTTNRTLHGALLDAKLLADVYLALTSWQGDLGFSEEEKPTVSTPDSAAFRRAAAFDIPVIRASAGELALHEQRLAGIAKAAGKCLWQASVATEQ